MIVYKSTLDAITDHISQVQRDARLIAVLTHSGMLEGEQLLDIINAAASGLSQLSHCLSLDMRKRADDYLPTSSPLRAASASDLAMR